MQTRWTNKCLDELDPPAWGEPEYDSHLVTTCHALRRKPVGDFETEDLRIMVGQSIGLRFLVPVALDVVEADPLAEGHYFPGDLLLSLLEIAPQFWRAYPDWRTRLASVTQRLGQIPDELAGAAARFDEHRG
jgi:hypothetical protein